MKEKEVAKLIFLKPFEPEELLRMFMVAQSIVLSQRSLTTQVEEAAGDRPRHA